MTDVKMDSSLHTADEVAKLEEQVADLRKIIDAFRINEEVALDLVKQNPEVWLDRAGLYAAALIDAYREVPALSHNDTKSALMKHWLEVLPDTPEQRDATQRQVSEVILAKLIKPL